MQTEQPILSATGKDKNQMNEKKNSAAQSMAALRWANATEADREQVRTNGRKGGRPRTEETRPYKVRTSCGHVVIRRMRPATAGVPFTDTTILEAPQGRMCHVCEGTDADVHLRDEDCSLDPSDFSCRSCLVSFSAACPLCDHAGFHSSGCPNEN